jgi:hypothetical protein
MPARPLSVTAIVCVPDGFWQEPRPQGSGRRDYGNTSKLTIYRFAAVMPTRRFDIQLAGAK